MWQGHCSGTGWRERKLLARTAGLVNSLHDFQSLISLLAGDQRLAAGTDGVAEILELPLERLDRNSHRIGGTRRDFLRQGRRIACIVLDIPGGELVTRDDGGALGAVELRTLGVARPKRRRCLEHTGGAGRITHNGVDNIFRFDFVQRAKLPVSEKLVNWTGQPAENIELVDGLIDQGAPALGGP